MRPLAMALGIGLIMLGTVWLAQEYSFVPGEFLPDLLSLPHRGAIAAAAGILILALLYLNPERRV